jgi:hypothetical protein
VPECQRLPGSKKVLRRQYKNAESASHNNRNLRSKTKQFAEDEWEQHERVVPILVIVENRE